MFQFLFKYPYPVFAKGAIILQSGWPRWLLWLSAAAIAAVIATVIARRLPKPVSRRGAARAATTWLLQTLLAGLLLVLLWRPALLATELSVGENIIAFVVDASRSMAIVEDGSSREARAIGALNDGLLARIAERYQTRVYRLDSLLARAADAKLIRPDGAATHVGAGLEQLADETAGLPLGAIVLLSDGADNGGGVDADTLARLRNRHIPVHTIGFGHEEPAHDVELDDVVIAPRALADSRITAVASFHQHGYSGRRSRLLVREGAHVLSSQEVAYGPEGRLQAETVLFNVGAAGVKALQFSLDEQPGEENRDNNALTRLVDADAERRSVLYVEGEPRWEYKFIRRAADEDRQLRLVSMLRTSQNKIYRQNVQDPAELSAGFPASARDLFAYQGLVIGSVEANYFTPAQRELIREFVDRRGGGLLLLGGRYALADGGWAASDLANLLPTVLPDGKRTFRVDPGVAQLTAAGGDSIITRLVDDPQANLARWKSLPYLMDYQNAGTAKPGATVLANVVFGGQTTPLLVTEPYGRGRTAELATSGTWRWQMSLPVGDPTFDAFWQQLLRWLVTDAHGPVVAAIDRPEIEDDSRAVLSADVRDENFQPVAAARVDARILGPDGTSTTVTLTPVAGAPGKFRTEWAARTVGDYVADVVAGRDQQALGHDVLHFRRIDGAAEHFHTEQNRALLERIATLTGGRYWRPQELATLAGEIGLSAAGISAPVTHELWNMPAVLILILILTMAEWGLRRLWGTV